MTGEALRQRIALWRDLLWVAALVSGFTLFVGNLLFWGAIALYGESIRARAQDWLGITAIHQQLDEVTGRTRVIREERGQSYVREPVYLGEPLTLVLVVARTQVGAACRLRQFTPLFTDDYGVTMAGAPQPPVRQIGTDFERLEIEIMPPRRLGLGHALLRLQLEYECGERTVYETTEPVGFVVVPREEGVP